MFQPNQEAVREALMLMFMATPFMFGVLTLFSLVIMGLSRLQGPTGESK